MIEIGGVVDEVRMPVEWGKVREFTRAVHGDADRYAAPDSDLALPLTFSAVAMHWREHGDATVFEDRLGLDMSRTVHGEAAWEYLAPVRIGDELTGVRRLADVKERRGRRGGRLRLLTLETEFTRQDGILAIRHRDVIVEREA